MVPATYASHPGGTGYNGENSELFHNQRSTQKGIYHESGDETYNSRSRPRNQGYFRLHSSGKVEIGISTNQIIVTNLSLYTLV